MSTIHIEFNPDCMEVRHVKECANILRALIQKRLMLEAQTGGDFTMTAEALLNSFDTLTQNITAK